MTSPEPDPSREKGRTRGRKSAISPEFVKALLALPNLEFKSREAPQERRSRLAIEGAKARHDLWRDKLLLSSSLMCVAVLGGVSVYFLVLRDQHPDVRTWAASSLSAIVSAVLTYSFGKPGKPG